MWHVTSLSMICFSLCIHLIIFVYYLRLSTIERHQIRDLSQTSQTKGRADKLYDSCSHLPLQPYYHLQIVLSFDCAWVPNIKSNAVDFYQEDDLLPNHTHCVKHHKWWTFSECLVFHVRLEWNRHLKWQPWFVGGLFLTKSFSTNR